MSRCFRFHRGGQLLPLCRYSPVASRILPSCPVTSSVSLLSSRRTYSGHMLGGLDEGQKLLQEGQIEQAMEVANAVLRQQQGGETGPLDVTAYETLAAIFSRAKRLDKAQHLLEEMEAKGVQPSLMTYTSVVSLANHPDTIAAADAIYDKLVDEGASLDAHFYDAYISSLVDARRFRRAHQIYFHMCKRQKIDATATTYKNLITIYGESKRWDLVQQVLRKMRNRNVIPQAMHYSAAVLAVAKAEGVEEAFALVENMQTHRDKYPVVPDENIFNALLEACCLRSATIDKSWRALRYMKTAGVKPSTRSYNHILEGLSKFRRSQEMAAVLDEMAREGVTRDSYTLALLVRAYANSANIGKALDLYREHKTAGFAPRSDVFRHLLQGLSQQVAEASAEAYDKAASSQTEALAQADALYAEMIQTDLPFSVSSFYHLIHMNHLSCNNNKALELYDEMKQRGVKPNAPLVQLMGVIVAQETHNLAQADHF